MEAWVGASTQLTAGTASGPLKQLYNPVMTPGTGAVSAGVYKRTPAEGTLYSIQVLTDGTNGGTIEIWDLNGAEVGADVNTLDAVTNAQLLALQTLGKAKLIFNQNFAAANDAWKSAAGPRDFVKGLAARFINSGPTGTCTLNLVVDGGNRKYQITG